MQFTLTNALMAMLIMAGAARASPTDETSNTEVTSIVSTGVIDRDISEGSDMGETSVESDCKHGACPEYNVPFDFMEEIWQNQTYTYTIRVNDCGQCISVQASDGGCANFISCGIKQLICVDATKGRGFRDKGGRKCFMMSRGKVGNCGLAKTTQIFWPAGKSC
ncbi:hypothetical protein VE02_06109 [Pseudogymnoascus sp. 03VT05]|nr:hypothetical protein VE02_06109 [Pseudogymnoascus sp. 03VT05]